MARPSTHTDRRLIQAAKELLPETGCSQLSLRQVAGRAHVNLGMLHYHFKTRGEFLRAVLGELYEEFFSGFQVEAQACADPLRRLHDVLLYTAHFARANRALLSALVRDVINGEPEVVEMARHNFPPRHLSGLYQLVTECQQAGLLSPLPPYVTMPLLLGCLGMPNLLPFVLQKMEGTELFGVPSERLSDELLSDSAIELRIQMVLNALGARS